MTPHRSARGASASPRLSALAITGCAVVVAAVVWSASSCSHSKSPAAATQAGPPASSSSSSGSPSAGAPTASTPGSTDSAGSSASSTSAGAPAEPATPVPQDAALLKDATAAINTLNTMDYHKVDADLDAWLAATAGPLHAQMTQTTAMLKLQFANQHISMSGRILTVRVDAENTTAGTAQVSGTDDVRIWSPASDKTNHDKFQAQLTRTSGGWKLTSYQNTGG